MTEFDTKQIPGITPAQWSRLRELLNDGRYTMLELPWLHSATGMDPSCGLELAHELVRLGAARVEWQLWHDCAEHPVEILNEPIVPDDWVCPECEEGSYPRHFEARWVLKESVVFV